MESQPYNLKQLIENIAKYFSSTELKLLCMALKVDYDDIEGDTKSDKAYHLVLYFERRLEVDRLIDECKKERPKVNWEDKPTKIDDSKNAPRKLVDQIYRTFNMDDLEMMRMNLGIDPEVVRGRTLAQKSYALVRYCDMAGRINALVAECKKGSSTVNWDIYKD